MKKIVFVCTGNTCRSPMAEAIARKEVEKTSDNIEFFSRGLSVYFPSGASEQSNSVMNEYGIDISSHLSKPLTPKDIEEVDILLTMTNQHKKHLLLNFPEHHKKIFTLREFVGEEGDIEDPFGGAIEDYRRCAESLDYLIKKAIQKIRHNV